jgi:hypothetical protein
MLSKRCFANFRMARPAPKGNFCRTVHREGKQEKTKTHVTIPANTQHDVAAYEGASCRLASATKSRLTLSRWWDLSSNFRK